MWQSDSRFSRSGGTGEIDYGLMSGIGLCFILVLAGAFIGRTGFAFLSPISFLIVAGGTIGAALVHFGSEDLQRAAQACRQVLYHRLFDPREKVAYFVRLSQAVRKDGLLVLENESRRAYDPFLKLALNLTVDAQEATEVRRMLTLEMESADDREIRNIQVFETLGSYAPAMGLIGTLMGLIHMLGALDSPSTVGPAMAVALVTTLYGAILSNMFFLPVAGRLRNRHTEERYMKSLILEAVISLGKQENPLVLEQRLQSFIPRKMVG